MTAEAHIAVEDEEADVKTFMDQHGIEPWLSANDRVETALRLAGLKVLLVERQWSADRWRIAFIRSEPFYFHPDAGTVERLCGVLARNGIKFDLADMVLTKASFRLEAVFTWAEGEPGHGVSYGFAKRGRLIELREEYRIIATT